MIAITGVALDAAVAAYGGAVHSPSDRHRMQLALEAVLPHLADTGEPLAPATADPSPYQVWRDALQLAVDRERTLGEQQPNRELLQDTRWFHKQLLAGPPDTAGRGGG